MVASHACLSMKVIWSVHIKTHCKFCIWIYLLLFSFFFFPNGEFRFWSTCVQLKETGLIVDSRSALESDSQCRWWFIEGKRFYENSETNKRIFWIMQMKFLFVSRILSLRKNNTRRWFTGRIYRWMGRTSRYLNLHNLNVNICWRLCLM